MEKEDITIQFNEINKKLLVECIKKRYKVEEKKFTTMIDIDCLLDISVSRGIEEFKEIMRVNESSKRNRLEENTWGSNKC